MSIARPLRRVFVLAAAFAISAFALATPATAQRKSILERYDTWEQFQNRHVGFLANDYRIVDLEYCREADGSKFWWVAVYQRLGFTNSGGFDHVYTTHDATEFNNEVQRLYNDGWRIDDVDFNGWYYSAIWNPAEGAQQVITANTWPDFEAQRTAQEGAGLRLASVDVALVNGERRYVGVMRAGAQQQQIYRNVSWAAFADTWQALRNAGWRLRDIAAVRRPGDPRYFRWDFISIYERGPGAFEIMGLVDWPTLMTRWGEIDATEDARIDDVECWTDPVTNVVHYAAVFNGIPSQNPEAPRVPRNPVVERDPN